MGTASVLLLSMQAMDLCIHKASTQHPALLALPCTCPCCLQAAQEKAARAMEAKLDRQRKEQEAAGMLLTERDAAVLAQQQDLQEKLR